MLLTRTTIIFSALLLLVGSSYGARISLLNALNDFIEKGSFLEEEENLEREKEFGENFEEEKGIGQDLSDAFSGVGDEFVSLGDKIKETFSKKSFNSLQEKAETDYMQLIKQAAQRFGQDLVALEQEIRRVLAQQGKQPTKKEDFSALEEKDDPWDYLGQSFDDLGQDFVALGDKVKGAFDKKSFNSHEKKSAPGNNQPVKQAYDKLSQDLVDLGNTIRRAVEDYLKNNKVAKKEDYGDFEEKEDPGQYLEESFKDLGDDFDALGEKIKSGFEKKSLSDAWEGFKGVFDKLGQDLSKLGTDIGNSAERFLKGQQNTQK